MVQVAIPESLAERLQSLAIRRGLSLQEVVQGLLAGALESPDREAARARLRVLLQEDGTALEEESIALALRV